MNKELDSTDNFKIYNLNKEIYEKFLKFIAEIGFGTYNGNYFSLGKFTIDTFKAPTGFSINIKISELKTIKSNSIWGQLMQKKDTKNNIKNYKCYPFINNISELERKNLLWEKHKINYEPERNTYINLNEIVDFFEKNNELEQKEIEILKKLVFFIESNIQQQINNKNDEKSIIDHNVTMLLSSLDVDGDGNVDIVDSGKDLKELLIKYQKNIIEIDKTNIQKFIKLSSHLVTKRNNIQLIFTELKELDLSTVEKNELFGILKNQIHSFELITFHSITMIVALVEGDLITFYEIYELFDKLNIFNSNWENEVSSKLTDIGDGLRDLIFTLNTMERSIVNQIGKLTYTTNDSFNSLQKSITSELNSINSSINFNNLLTGIQIYQGYKIKNN